MCLSAVVQLVSSEALLGEPSSGIAVQQKVTYPSTEDYTEFARRHEPSLRYALVAQLGYEAGREATQDALVWAWEHWGRIRSVSNPGGYLFRVAKRRALRQRVSRGSVVVDLPEPGSPRIEPGLDDALGHLSKRQRAVVFLVEGLGLSYQETADQLGISRSAVQTHLERALARLRDDLGVTLDV
jgi:DNA-directed RNA polymerase specialized sigma24 family protein